MSVPLIINGVTFQYPQQGDKNWGPVMTNWSSAVTSGMLQKAGGSFPLTAEADFGNSFGLKVKSIKSEETTIAQSGFLRLCNASAGVVWRNATDGADLVLTVNASNQLTFNGISVGATTSLTNAHILVGNVSNQPADVAMSGDVTIDNTGATTLGAGKVLNSNVNASAAIALSKLAAVSAYQWLTGNASGVLGGTSVTASRAVVTDSNGLPAASSVTSTELGYVSGVTSGIQTQIDGKSTIPPGALMDFAGTVAPSGWLLCDGSAVSRTTYSALFTAVSTTWGAGDGSTTFNLPNLSRRVTVGAGGVGSGTLGNAVGNTGGEETHTLVTGEIPAHNHGASVTDPGHFHQERTYQSGAGADQAVGGAASTAGGTTFTASHPDGTTTNTTGISVSTSNTGGGSSHNNIQPSAIVLKIIKY